MNGIATTARVDSGADVTVVPAELVAPSAYTGRRQWTGGLNIAGHLPTATVMLTIQGKETKMTVVLKEGLSEILLGLDHPDAFDLLIESARAAKAQLTPQPQLNPQPQLIGQPPQQAPNKEESKEKDQGCLAAEAEDSGCLAAEAEDVEVAGAAMKDTREFTEVLNESLEVYAVQTRAQKRREEQEQQEDDEASAHSEANPTPLTQLDDSLFGRSKTRDKLTRSQKRAQAKERVSTSTSQVILDIEQLKTAQQQDPTLQQWRESAATGEGPYLVANGILCRTGEDEWGGEVMRPVIPVGLRAEFLKRAHDEALSSHLGARKSAKRLLQSFYWPGVHEDMRAHRLQCAECQKAAKRNRNKAPLNPLPAIDEPFHRIATDLVGPLRRTSRGNRYILTVMDYATRYPEAIPLRRINAETVAEALCGVFTRFGIPAEILSDQGSQFTSSLMHRVLQLLDVRHIKTSPYHPETDGMIERFHATMKAMLLRKDSPSGEWDRLLPYVCFAYRSAAHAVTGHSPFALMFGREVQGPLTLLRRQLLGETPKDLPVCDFVDSLKSKLRAAWEHASDLEIMAKQKSKVYHDAKAKQRSFAPGDMVLVFEPGPHKLDAQWMGPYKVLKKVTNVTYLISLPDRRKKSRNYHVNGMRAWQEPAKVYSVQYCEEEHEDLTGEPQLYTFERGGQSIPNIAPDLSPDKRQQLMTLIQQHQRVFDANPGETHLRKHSIPTDSPPIALSPRRIPQAWAGSVREEIHEMLAAGVIEESTSPWTFPIVPVRKRDGATRICVDYRKLNKVTADDVYQMPRVEEILEKVGSAKFITTLDLSKGYYQVPLTEEDKPKTAFSSPFGKFQFRKMPFGLKSASATFQRLMDIVLAPCHGYASSYIDDITVYSDSWESHLQHLHRVLECLADAGLTAKPRKCLLGATSCDLLGHTIGNGQVTLQEAKIKAIADFPRPSTKKQIRAFLGLAGYYRRFVPHFSDKAAALTDCTRQQHPDKITWSAPLETSFQSLKAALSSQPVLHCPEENLQFVLQTDASARGVGAVLSQRLDNGEEHPIAYYSRKLLPRETNYSSIEKECLAIVAALRHFDVYLVGRHFVVETDHRALRFLNVMCNSNSRLTRWAMAVQQFSFDVYYRPGPQNGNADGLSRQPWEEIDNERPSSDANDLTRGEVLETSPNYKEAPH